MVPLDYIQTALLDYGVHKAPSQHLWKIAKQCWVINTSPNPMDELDWSWIKTIIGYDMLDVSPF